MRNNPFTLVKKAAPLLCMAALLLPLHFANACTDGYYGEDYRVAFLNPYIVGEGYSAFFYSSEYLNTGKNDTNGSDRRRNCEEWAQQLGQGVTYTDVKAFLYGTSLDDVLNAIAEGADNKRFGENMFLKTLLKPANKAILDYLVFSKKYEHLSNANITDPWVNRWDQPAIEIGFSKEQLQAEAEAALSATKDPWLRRRYAYQLMLMYRYEGNRAKFDSLFDTYFKDDRSTVLSDWAMHHKAAMVSDADYSAYLYAMSFDRCPEKNVASYQNFDKKRLAQALSFAQNDHERASILALFEIKNPGRSLANIQKITTLDPGNRFLPLLLVREVNKLEDWLLTDRLTDQGPAIFIGYDGTMRWDLSGQQWNNYLKVNRQKDQRYLAEFRGFIVKTIGQKGMDSNLLHLLAAHLLNMEKDPAAAGQLAAISGQSSQGIQEQKATEEMLLLLNREDISKPATQDKMAALLTQLKGIYKTNPKGARNFEALNLLLKEAYQQQGNLLYAYCFNNHALDLPSKDHTFSTAYYSLLNFLDWKASEKDIDDVLALIGKPDKTALEKYLTQAYFPSRNALLDLRGTISFRKNDLPEALAAFSKVEQDFWKTKYEFNANLISDPFVIWKDSTHRGDFPATKTAFVQRLIDLETTAKTDPAKAADNYLLLGTAWLNCTHRGKSWMMFCYGQSINDMPGEVDFNTYLPRSRELTDVYFYGTRAQEYLNKAKAAAPNDREVAARADYLLARKNSIVYQLTPAEQAELDKLQWGEQGNFYRKKEMSFYKSWVANYKETEAWNEVTDICPVLRTYFGM
ncbi:MAG: hypothetical protein KDD27_11585 [Saprospiraceae bacterium]|nr:hypothetical protein [Saprospiraceae bacterium]